MTKWSFVAICLASCASVHVPDGAFSCVDATDCPSGWVCSAGLCFREAPRSDAATLDASRDSSVDASFDASFDTGTGLDASLDVGTPDVPRLDAGDAIDAGFDAAIRDLCNGIDDDGDSRVDEDAVDGDGDGDCRELDCNDGNPLVGPSALEICGNPTDENCNGMTDDGCCPPSMVFDDGFCRTGFQPRADCATAANRCASLGGCATTPFGGLLPFVVGKLYMAHNDEHWGPMTHGCWYPIAGTATQLGCGGGQCSTSGDITSSICTDPNCSLEYVCATLPLLPTRLPCTTDADCGRDRECVSGDCIEVDTSRTLCCTASQCPGGECADVGARFEVTEGRFEIPMGRCE